MNDKNGQPMAQSTGHPHPMTAAIRQIYSIFRDIGYDVAQGPELETEFYNFDALNVPKDHPARDMQDTFWIKSKDRKVLRTQTTAVQLRYMGDHKPPFKVLVPGKVFRNEATDATHEAQFYQFDVFCVDKKNVSLADLKGVLTYFLQKFFGDDVVVRFRPSFFPFTEPSVEVDMQWKGKWLEIAGAGLMHPKVLSLGGIDSSEWAGFAFAFGIDRLVMLKYGIDDIRLLYQGDLRLVNQFS